MRYIPSPLGSSYDQYTQQPNYNYNNPYYNQYQYYNPSEIYERQKREQEERQKAIDNHNETIKELTRVSNKALGYGFDPKAYDTDVNRVREEVYKYIPQQVHMMDLSTRARLIREQQEQRARQEEEERIRAYEERKTNLEQGQGLTEFLQEQSERNFDLYLSTCKSAYGRNLGGLYDSQSFAELLHAHNNGYGSLSPNIDDQEISLPAKLKGEHAERRRRFMESILNAG